MKPSRWRRLLPLLVVLAFAAAVFLVWREVRPYGLAGMLQAVAAIPRDRLAVAGAFTAASYAALTLFDWLGLRYAEHPLPYPKAALASFVALSIGHALGLAPLGSGALRARYYAQWGLDAEAIGKVILFCAATVIIGEVAVAAIVLLVAPHRPADAVHRRRPGRGRRAQFRPPHGHAAFSHRRQRAALLLDDGGDLSSRQRRVADQPRARRARRHGVRRALVSAERRDLGCSHCLPHRLLHRAAGARRHPPRGERAARAPRCAGPPRRCRERAALTRAHRSTGQPAVLAGRSRSISSATARSVGRTEEGQAPSSMPSGPIRDLWKFQSGVPASPSSAEIQRKKGGACGPITSCLSVSGKSTA